jgi:hypothetical protein
LRCDRYLSPLTKDILGWEEERNIAFHKQGKGPDVNLKGECIETRSIGGRKQCIRWKPETFESIALGGCTPKKSKGPKWQNRYPLEGCIEHAAWDWWNKAAYLDYILYFWARRKMLDDLCRRGLQVDEDAKEHASGSVGGATNQIHGN